MCKYLFHFGVPPTSELVSIVYFEILITVIFKAGVLYALHITWACKGCVKCDYDCRSQNSEIHTQRNAMPSSPLLTCFSAPILPTPAQPTPLGNQSLWFLLYPFCISSEKLKRDVYFPKSLFSFSVIDILWHSFLCNSMPWKWTVCFKIRWKVPYLLHQLNTLHLGPKIHGSSELKKK